MNSKPKLSASTVSSSVRTQNRVGAPSGGIKQSLNSRVMIALDSETAVKSSISPEKKGRVVTKAPSIPESVKREFKISPISQV